MMRIISGRARGTKLLTLEGDSTRPTLERVKEAMFSMIQFEISGRSVLDLFGGSGQLALEALSRGALRADIADSSAAAGKIIKTNIEKTHFGQNAFYHRMSAENFIKNNSGKRTYSLVFLDPPYAKGLLKGVLQRLTSGGMLEKDAVLVCECDKDDRADVIIPENCGYSLRREAVYSSTRVLILDFDINFGRKDSESDEPCGHALIPGSFDPFTKGHRALVVEARKKYEKVTVAVMVNSAKEYLFTPDERMAIAKASISDIDGVDVIYDGGMLFELFDSIGADMIVKGVRNDSDRKYEEEMAKFNIGHNPRAKTLLLDAKDDFREVSSTDLREKLARGEDFLTLLADGARDTVLEIFKNK